MATAATTSRPSAINMAIPTSADTFFSAKTSKSKISKPRRLSLPPTDIDSHLQQPQHGRVLRTPTMLSDCTSTSYFHDDLSNSVMFIKNQSPGGHEPHFFKAGNEKSIETVQQLMTPPPPGVDGHMSYKIKSAKSSRKLDCFFGEHAPQDTCMKEIRKEGLKAILESKTPLCYFLYHLLKEYCSENLFFFIEIEQYEAFKYSSTVQQFATAQRIYSTYLARESQFEVNLDDKVRRTVTDALRDKCMQGCFTTAKRAVYDLLESSYMRFRRTDVFDLMVHNCGELITNYDEAARHAAPRLLLQYLEQQHAMIYTNPHTDQVIFLSTSNQTFRRRHELIRSMIQGFCRTMLDLQIDLSSSSFKSSTTEGHCFPKSLYFLFSKRKH